MIRLLCSLLCTTIIAGCANPVVSRTTHPDNFKVLQTAQVDPTKVQAVADCIHDGFGAAHSMLANTESRILRRAEGFRIETTTGKSVVLVSADVLEGGVAELREGNHAAWINTTGEREAFAKCTSQWPRPGAK